MTIHDYSGETNREPVDFDASTANAGPSTEQPNQSGAAGTPVSPAATTDPGPQRRADGAADFGDEPEGGTGPSTEASLFGAAELEELRREWANVQAGFVDDPRRCVTQADGLVLNVVQQLSSGFSEARSRLEEQWGRGQTASTEDLRVALKRYRDFFDRLLAV